MSEVVALIGNPRSGSRTARAAREVARQVSGLLGQATVREVDLAEHAGGLFDAVMPELDALAEAAAAADVLVVASPTYKATYTGLLKAFFDRAHGRSLAGVVAVPLMVGAAPQHALAPEVHLRPLLVELGAVVPTRALYVLESELELVEERVSAWLQEARAHLVAAVEAVRSRKVQHG